MDQDQYLKSRVDDQIDYYAKSANKAKKAHVRIQTSVIVLALLAPVGILMGMPMPVGLSLVGRRPGGSVAWAWGINGAMSVLASVAAILMAVLFGFTVSFTCGLACYVAALLARPSHDRQ